jgi:hypothetical protein
LQIYSGIGRMAEVFLEETLAEIYAGTPNARSAGTFGSAGAVCEAVDGGYPIRGRGHWPCNSGCHRHRAHQHQDDRGLPALGALDAPAGRRADHRPAAYGGRRDLIAFTRQGAMAPYVNWERYGRHLVGAHPASLLPPGR